MEDSSERSRRNSIERYQAKGRWKDNETDITEKLSNATLSDEKQPHQNKRRGVNNHLYSQGNQTSRRGRGNSHRGRGKGRGSIDNINSQQNRHDENLHQANGWGQSDNKNMNFNSNPSQQTFENQKTQRVEEQIQQNGRKYTPRKKNTENFKPSHKPTDMRILAAQSGLTKYNREITSRDVLIVHDLFCAADDLTLYHKLLNEIKNSDVAEMDLWQLWHGDSHLIADDKKKWKESCPTFHMIVNKIKEYFQMDVKATRLNWYRNSSEWKPFHHDAAAIKPDKAKTQNLTVAVSFGAERDAAFEHATTKTTIAMPQPNGTIYVFAKDVNVIWRHGILQCPPDKYHDEGRISIIAWGWSEQTQV